MKELSVKSFCTVMKSLYRGKIMAFW